MANRGNSNLHDSSKNKRDEFYTQDAGIEEKINAYPSYAYDAFGNTIAKSGPLADSFHHCFSTKYLDAETSLYYYGYRFYSPELMRWINRDPIEEQGGVNLYAFCENEPSRKIDYFGRETLIIDILPGSPPNGGWDDDGIAATVRRIYNRDITIGGRRIGNNCIQMILVFDPPNSLFFIYYRKEKTPFIKAQELEHIACHEKYYDRALDSIYQTYNGKIYSQKSFEQAQEAIFTRTRGRKRLEFLCVKSDKMDCRHKRHWHCRDIGTLRRHIRKKRHCVQVRLVALR